MPRYHALDTAVKLCVWDPKADPSLKIEGDDTTTTTAAEFAFAKHNGIQCSEKKEKSGPANGYIVDDLKEEYFEGHEGVDFLGPSMPFYLVKAGRELFATEQEQEEAHQPPIGFKDLTPMTTASTAIRNDTSNTSLISLNSDPDVGLASMDAEFSTPSGSFTTPEHGKSSTRLVIGPVKSSLERSKPCNETRNEAVVKPITSPKLLKIAVEISQKSFMTSLVTSLRQELCITIYYNGELTQSRIIRPSTFGSPRGPVSDDRFQYYSGRRIDSHIEVPWVVLPHPPNVSDPDAMEVETMGFEERWDKVNQMLLVEADQWGQYGRYRSPMGEYLEELSKRGIPKCTKNKQSGGDRAGIIDIIITMGRSVSASVSGLREPRRKLHEDYCGLKRQFVTAPEELRPQKKARIVADFNIESSLNTDPSMWDKGATSTGRGIIGDKKSAYTGTQIVATDNNPPAPILSNDQDGLSGPFSPLADNQESIFQSEIAQMSPRPVSCMPSLPTSSSSPLAHDSNLSKSFPVPAKQIGEHPKTPGYILQKRHQGTDSSGSGLSPEPQIPKSSSGDLLSDQKSTLAFTRLRRATNSPTLSALDALTSENLVRGGQTIRHVETSNSSNIMSSSHLQSVNGIKPGLGECSAVTLPTRHLGISTLKYMDPSSSRGEMLRSNPKLSSLHYSDQVPVESISTIAALSENQNSQQWVTENASMVSTATRAAVGNRGSAAIEHEDSKIAHVPSPPANDVRSWCQSMPPNLDGTGDELRRGSRPRSSTASTRSRSSLEKSETKSAAETPFSLTDQSPQQDATKAVASQKLTQIVFKIGGKDVSTSVDSKGFEQLKLPSFAIKDTTQEMQSNLEKSSVAAQQATNSPSLQMDSHIAEDNPPRKKFNRAKAAAASRNSNSKVAVARSCPTQTNKPAPKRQKRSGPVENQDILEQEKSMIDTPSICSPGAGFLGGKTVSLLPKRITEMGSMGGKTSFPVSGPIAELGSMGGKTIFTPQPEAEAEAQVGPMGGKTIFYRPAPYRKQKSRSRKGSNAASEAPGKIETSPQTQPKAKRHSTASTQQLGAALESSKKIEAPQKMLLKPKRNSVSSGKQVSRSGEGIDAGETPSKIRRKHKKDSISSRELKELFSPHQGVIGVDVSFAPSFKEAPGKSRPPRKLKSVYAPPDIPFNIMKAGASQHPSTTGSTDDEVTPIEGKSGSSRKESLYPNLLPTLEDTVANLFAKPIQGEIHPSVSSSKSKSNAKKVAKSPAKRVWPVAVIESRIDAENKTATALSATEEPPIEGTAPTHQKFATFSHFMPVGSLSTGCSVNSEGKTPSIRLKNSTPDSMNSLQIQSSTKVIPTTPEMQAVMRRKPPATILPQNISGRANVEVAGPTANGKTSISETLTLQSPATATTTSTTPNQAPVSQSRAKAKRKAVEISSGSGRQWNPTFLCDDSVLGYATEIWPNMRVDSASKNVCRTIKAEREGVFRASGVLMGVRFVVGLL